MLFSWSLSMLEPGNIWWCDSELIDLGADAWCKFPELRGAGSGLWWVTSELLVIDADILWGELVLVEFGAAPLWEISEL